MSDLDNPFCSDLEKFQAFFAEMGVPCRTIDDPHCGVAPGSALEVGSTWFHFDEQGNFTCIEDDQTGVERRNG